MSGELFNFVCSIAILFFLGVIVEIAIEEFAPQIALCPIWIKRP